VALALRVQELDQVGLVGRKPLLGGLELLHAGSAIAAFPLRLMSAHRYDRIDSRTPRCPVLNTDRSCGCADRYDDTTCCRTNSVAAALPRINFFASRRKGSIPYVLADD
jgi:hypothetical protein